MHFAFVAAPAFHMPMHPECPSVWVAAGTGIAPFRSFWRERIARRKYVGELAPALLIFGCRTLEHDSLYKQVREAAKHSPLSPAQRHRSHMDASVALACDFKAYNATRLKPSAT